MFRTQPSVNHATIITARTRVLPIPFRNGFGKRLATAVCRHLIEQISEAVGIMYHTL